MNRPACYRQKLSAQLQALGYWIDWHLFNAADFGVCQLRPRVATSLIKALVVAMRLQICGLFVRFATKARRM